METGRKDRQNEIFRGDIKVLEKKQDAVFRPVFWLALAALLVLLPASPARAQPSPPSGTQIMEMIQSGNILNAQELIANNTQFNPQQAGSIIQTIQQALNGGNIGAAQIPQIASVLQSLLSGSGPAQQALEAFSQALSSIINSAAGSSDTPGGDPPQFQPTQDPDAGPTTCTCAANIPKHHDVIKSHMTFKREEHERWMVTEFFTRHVAPALMLMAEQLTAAGMQQVQIIGAFFDAKHQLETQRLMQQMTAIAHKDYQPSEGMCTFGTNMRSLAASDRNTELSLEVISARTMQRQTLSGDNLAGESGFSDYQSRFNQFIATYCNPKDNANGLELLCGSGGGNRRPNNDINYTGTIDVRPTLDLDFTKAAKTEDSEDIFALAANLYGHQLVPQIKKILISVDDDDQPSAGAKLLQDARALIAKRSVAQNSFAAIASERSLGEKEVQPYMYKLLEEMGIPEEDIKTMLGARPSYFAQMEVLTKKIYQNPNFYTDLYDKPANVKRKEVAMQAIDLMQKRDIFRSLLRAEATLSVMLEAALIEEQSVITNEVNPGGN